MGYPNNSRSWMRCSPRSPDGGERTAVDMDFQTSHPLRRCFGGVSQKPLLMIGRSWRN